MSKINTNWNFNILISGESEKEIDKELKLVEDANNAFIEKWESREDYLKDPKVLLEAIDEFENLNNRFGQEGNAGYYIWLKQSIEQDNPKVKELYGKIDDFSNKLKNRIQFFQMRIAKIPTKEQEKFLTFKGLEKYKHYLERLFSESKYLLSEPEEKILTLKSATSHSNWTKMIASFISKEEREVINEDGKNELMNFSKIQGLIDNQDKKIRDTAANAIDDISKKWIEVAEHEINSVLANKKVDDELRGFKRPDEARHFSDDMDTEVVDALVKAVTSRYDISKRFYKLKADLFGVEKLAYHERNLTYGKADKKYTYEEAFALAKKVLTELDPEFGEILQGFNDESLIDVYPNKGKRGGAFCAYNLKSQPTYMLLNFNGKVDDINTLAHETGHGINDELIKKSQNSLNFGTPTSTAEVASTFMEDFVFEELLSNADDEMKLSLMVSKLNDDINTIIRQINFYNFETDLHKNFREKNHLSKEQIGELYKKNSINMLGDAISFEEGRENWWISVPHFRYFFYVYSYSSGLLISKSLQASVKKDKKFINKVKEFLGTGLSDSPKNIFKKLGIDITDEKFWQKGLDEVENLLKETEDLAKKLGKI